MCKEFLGVKETLSLCFLLEVRLGVRKPIRYTPAELDAC